MSLFSGFQKWGLCLIPAPLEEPRIGTVSILTDFRGADYIIVLILPSFSHHLSIIIRHYLIVQRG